MVVIVYVLWGLGGLSIILCAIVVVITIQRLHLVVEGGYNDDDEAKKRFLDLVKDSHEELLIHDSGDPAHDLYCDRDVVKSVEDCLNKGVTIRCLFNEESSLDLVDKLGSHDKLEVYYLNGDPPDCDVHYKIVDYGRRVYLSYHCEEGDREFKMINCSRSPSIRRRLYRDYNGRFEEGLRNARRLPVPAAG